MYIYRGKLDLNHYVENEAITVIIPTSFRSGESVYFFWKWTKTPAGCSESHFSDIGTIEVETKAKIMFLHDNYYFDATFSYGLKSLVLIMRLKDGTTQDPMALNLVYDRQFIDQTSIPRLFTGRINLGGPPVSISAVDEMFVVVVPGLTAHRQPLCAFWQWTKAKDGNMKVNVDCVDQIRSVTRTPKGETVTFAHGDDYAFQGALSENNQKLIVTMKNSQDEALSDIVLQGLSCTARNNPLALVTSSIENDTQEVIYCTLKEWDRDTGGVVDKTLAWTGMALALAGLPSVVTAVKLSAKAAELLGMVVARGGVAVAGAGLAQLLSGSDQSPKSATLFPGESIRRTSSPRPTSDNGVQIIHTYVNVTGGSHSIIVSSIEKAPLGESITKFSELKTDPGATITILLQFQLPNPPANERHDTASHKLQMFRNMRPQKVGTPIDNLPNLISGDVFSTETTSSGPGITKKLRSHGKLASLISEAQGGTEKKIFNCAIRSDSSSWDIHIDTTTSSTSQLYKTFGLRNGTQVLKLENCTIQIERGGPSPPTQVEISGWDGTDDKALELIYNTPENGKRYWAYTNNEDRTKLITYSSLSLRLSVSYKEGNVVYLVADSGPLIYRKMVTVPTS